MIQWVTSTFLRCKMATRTFTQYYTSLRLQQYQYQYQIFIFNQRSPNCRSISIPACYQKTLVTTKAKKLNDELGNHVCVFGGDTDNVFTHVFTPFRNEELNSLIMDIKTSSDCSLYDWRDVQKIMENSTHERLRKHWPSLMMTFLAQLKFNQLATSLLDFLLAEKLEPHLALISTYIGMQAESANADEILRAYEMLDTRILDPDSIGRIVKGLSQTRRWRECLNLLEMNRITGSDSMLKYGPVIVAAVQNSDLELALKLVRQCCENNLTPNADVYDAFAARADEKNMWRFLSTVGEFRCFMKESQAMNLKSWFQRNRYDVKSTRTDNNVGRCGRCGRELSSSQLTETEFVKLKENFMKKSVVRGDIFISTTPQELAKFQQFLQKNSPFDIVIDALNIAHSGRKWDMKIVPKTVELFTRKNQKVLVVSRRHTAQNRFMRQLKCPVFYTSDLSKDDPFVLYAALWSGPNCQIVTRDEMRDHCFLLGIEQATVFRKWQRTHQIMVAGLRPNGRLELVQPPIHDVAPQRHGQEWHVPYDDMDERVSFALPETWLCARKHGEQT